VTDTKEGCKTCKFAMLRKELVGSFIRLRWKELETESGWMCSKNILDVHEVIILSSSAFDQQPSKRSDFNLHDSLIEA